MKKVLPILLLLIFAFSISVYAQNKIYIAPETATIFAEAGGDELIDSSSLLDNGVVSSSFLDLGAGSFSPDYAITFITNGWATAPVAGLDVINLYVGFGTSTTQFDGSPTTPPTDAGTATVFATIVDNLQHVVAVIGTSTATNAVVQASARFSSVFRYLYFVVENKSSGGDALSATGVEIVVIPVPLEIQ